MANRKLLSTVYPNLAGTADATRINPMVSTLDCRTLISVSGDPHILAHICQLAIKTTAAYVRHHNFTLVDSDKLAEFLRQRSAFPVDAPKAASRDDAGRDSRGGEQVKDAADRKSVPRKGITRGRK